MALCSAPDLATGSDAIMERAYLTAGTKAKATAPRIAIIEVTVTGDVCRMTVPNIDGTGVEPAERRRAALAKFTSNVVKVKDI